MQLNKMWQPMLKIKNCTNVERQDLFENEQRETDHLLLETNMMGGCMKSGIKFTERLRQVKKILNRFFLN